MSIINSIRSQIVPIHPEGYPFIGGFALHQPDPVLALDAARLDRHASLTAWCAYFFRDPPRVTPLREGLVVAPADGRVSQVVNAVPPPELGLGDRPLPRISIFMSVFDCHVNRSPVTGRIERIVYRAGIFLNADLDKASEDNERNAFLIDDRPRRIGVVQIAGLIARRIVPLRARGPDRRGRRPHRHDPLRLARRRLPAGGRAGRWWPRARPRSPAKPCSPISAPTSPAAQSPGRLIVNAAQPAAPWRVGPANRYIAAMTFSPFDRDQLEARRRRFRAIPVRTLVPNLITLLALCAGLTAIRLALRAEARMGAGRDRVRRRPRRHRRPDRAA